MRESSDLKEFFSMKLQQWTDVLHNELALAGVPRASVQRVPVVPTGDYEGIDLSLPDREHWLADFWTACYGRISTGVQPALVKLNQRLKKPGEIIKSDWVGS